MICGVSTVARHWCNTKAADRSDIRPCDLKAMHSSAGVRPVQHCLQTKLNGACVCDNASWGCGAGSWLSFCVSTCRSTWWRRVSWGSTPSPAPPWSTSAPKFAWCTALPDLICADRNALTLAACHMNRALPIRCWAAKPVWCDTSHHRCIHPAVKREPRRSYIVAPVAHLDTSFFCRQFRVFLKRQTVPCLADTQRRLV